MPPEIRKFFLMVKFDVKSDGTAVLEVGGTGFGGRLIGSDRFQVTSVLGRLLDKHELEAGKLNDPFLIRKNGPNELIIDDPTGLSSEPVRLERQAAR